MEATNFRCGLLLDMPVKCLLFAILRNGENLNKHALRSAVRGCMGICEGSQIAVSKSAIGGLSLFYSAWSPISEF